LFHEDCNGERVSEFEQHNRNEKKKRKGGREERKKEDERVVLLSSSSSFQLTSFGLDAAGE